MTLLYEDAVYLGFKLFACFSGHASAWHEMEGLDIRHVDRLRAKSFISSLLENLILLLHIQLRTIDSSPYLVGMGDAVRFAASDRSPSPNLGWEVCGAQLLPCTFALCQPWHYYISVLARRQKRCFTSPLSHESWIAHLHSESEWSGSPRHGPCGYVLRNFLVPLARRSQDRSKERENWTLPPVQERFKKALDG